MTRELPALGTVVETPRGLGVVRAVTQGLFSVVEVRLGSNVDVEFPARYVRPFDGFQSVSAVDSFLNERPALADVEAFLADPQAKARTLPSDGQTRGAQTRYCDCTCGRNGGCMRLSTAPNLHQPQTGACRCEVKDCTCA